MKIAVDVLSIREDGSAGGATGFAIELINGLAEEPGVEVCALCGDWNEKILKKQLSHKVKLVRKAGGFHPTGIKCIDLRLERFFDRFRKDNSLKNMGIDILYCPFSAVTFKEKNIPAVSTILDIQHEYYPQFFTQQELEHRRNFYREIVSKSERVVCISDYTKQTFCEKYCFPIEKASTIYIAIQNRFHQKDDSIFTNLGIGNKKYLIYPANFWEHKNHKLLLNAFAMFAQEENDLCLVLTGNPLEKSDYYRDMIAAMKLEERVFITGYVSNEQLYSLLDKAYGLIYPSLFEGFGIPIVEAMALKKPIASSNLTSLPEVGCDSIFYFDPKKPDEILKGIRFLYKAVYDGKMEKSYQQKLSDFTLDKMVRDYLAVFKEVVENDEVNTFSEGSEGIYPDGWTSETVEIRLKNRKGTVFKAELVHPEFAKFKQKVEVQIDDCLKEYVLIPGEKIDLSEIITSDQFEVVIRVNRTWKPSVVLKSDDVRELGLKVEKLLI